MTSNENRGSKKRLNSPTGWIAGGVFLIVLLGVLFFYDGRAGTTSTSGSNPPNVVSGSSDATSPKK
jgi:hypothetical protein